MFEKSFASMQLYRRNEVLTSILGNSPLDHRDYQSTHMRTIWTGCLLFRSMAKVLESRITFISASNKTTFVFLARSFLDGAESAYLVTFHLDYGRNVGTLDFPRTNVPIHLVFVRSGKVDNSSQIR